MAVSTTLLASGGYENTARIWDVTSGQCKKTLKGHKDTIWGLDVLNSNVLVSGSADQTIKMWDISTGRNTKTIKTGKAIHSLISYLK